MKNKIKVLPTDRLVFDLEMYQIDYNEQKIKSLRQEIADKYKVPLKNVEINFVPKTFDKKGNKISLAEDVIKNIQQPEFQQSLFNEYINEKNITDVNINEIKDIDNVINSYIDFDSYSKYKNYKFKYVKWDNYLSYGKDNYFDFTKLNGLVLLTGNPENQCGKTTFAIDLLRFALFGSASKSPTLDSVFNIYLPETTEVKVEACLEIDGIDYVIRRTVTRPALNKRTAKSKPKQKVEYFKLINGTYELIENCEAETVAQTNNVIKESVGSIEDFNLVISATSYTLSDLIRLGQTDKSKLFSRWLGLVSLEEKEKISKDYYKNNVANKLLSNKYDKASLLNEINDFKTVIIGEEKSITENELKKKDTEINIEKINAEKIDILSKRKEIKEILTDVRTIENNISTNSNDLEIKRSQFSQMKKDYTLLKDSSFDKENYESKKRELGVLQTRNGELKGLISANKNELKRIEILMSEEKCPTCGHKIDIAEQNDFIKKLNDENSRLINEGVENKKNIELLEKEIFKLETDRENVEKLNNLKLKMSAVKVTIDNLKLKIENLNKQKEEYETNRENIIFNNEITNQIRIVDEKLKVENNLKDKFLINIQKSKSDIKNYQDEISKREKIITILNEEEKTIKNWNLYQQMVGKNGIIKIVLKRALPIVNNEVKRLLNGLCDFDVILSISDDNKVCLDLYRDGQKLDLGRAASGFEATISSLALRCALGNIAAISRCSFITFDEILSGISAENIENIFILYKRILNTYDFILHICHDTNVVDYHDHIITVYKKNNVSVIEMIK